MNTGQQNQKIINEENLFVEEEEKETSEGYTFPKIGKDRYFEGVGRRKTSVARVRIFDETNPSSEKFNIVINNRPHTAYFFNNLEFIKIVEMPLRKLKTYNYAVKVKVKGGGLRGQAEAIRLGLSRALVKLNDEWRYKFKKAGFLTRDAREVERKKYGLKKARKAPQWHKR